MLIRIRSAKGLWRYELEDPSTYTFANLAADVIQRESEFAFNFLENERDFVTSEGDNEGDSSERTIHYFATNPSGGINNLLSPETKLKEKNMRDGSMIFLIGPISMKEKVQKIAYIAGDGTIVRENDDAREKGKQDDSKKKKEIKKKQETERLDYSSKGQEEGNFSKTNGKDFIGNNSQINEFENETKGKSEVESSSISSSSTACRNVDKGGTKEEKSFLQKKPELTEISKKKGHQTNTNMDSNLDVNKTELLKNKEQGENDRSESKSGTETLTEEEIRRILGEDETTMIPSSTSTDLPPVDNDYNDGYLIDENGDVVRRPDPQRAEALISQHNGVDILQEYNLRFGSSFGLHNSNGQSRTHRSSSMDSTTPEIHRLREEVKKDVDAMGILDPKMKEEIYMQEMIRRSEEVNTNTSRTRSRRYGDFLSNGGGRTSSYHDSSNINDAKISSSSSSRHQLSQMMNSYEVRPHIMNKVPTKSKDKLQSSSSSPPVVQQKPTISSSKKKAQQKATVVDTLSPSSSLLGPNASNIHVSRASRRTSPSLLIPSRGNNSSSSSTSSSGTSGTSGTFSSSKMTEASITNSSEQLDNTSKSVTKSSKKIVKQSLPSSSIASRRSSAPTIPKSTAGYPDYLKESREKREALQRKIDEARASLRNPTKSQRNRRDIDSLTSMVERTSSKNRRKSSSLGLGLESSNGQRSTTSRTKETMETLNQNSEKPSSSTSSTSSTNPTSANSSSSELNNTKILDSSRAKLLDDELIAKLVQEDLTRERSEVSNFQSSYPVASSTSINPNFITNTSLATNNQLITEIGSDVDYELSKAIAESLNIGMESGQPNDNQVNFDFGNNENRSEEEDLKRVLELSKNDV